MQLKKGTIDDARSWEGSRCKKYSVSTGHGVTLEIHAVFCPLIIKRRDAHVGDY